VRAAATLRDARAVEPLVSLLNVEDPAVRSSAATALGRLNDTRAVQALVASTQDPEQEVRDAASDALNGMGMAAVIVVVANVMRDAVREQLDRGEEEADVPKQVGAGATDNTLPPASLATPPATQPAPPPTWTQEVLGRLFRRAGGRP
jgi:HEAT repeat protein